MHLADTEHPVRMPLAVLGLESRRVQKLSLERGARLACFWVFSEDDEAAASVFVGGRLDLLAIKYLIADEAHLLLCWREWIQGRTSEQRHDYHDDAEKKRAVTTAT